MVDKLASPCEKTMDKKRAKVHEETKQSKRVKDIKKPNKPKRLCSLLPHSFIHGAPGDP
jgi:hypothetical protein